MLRALEGHSKGTQRLHRGDARRDTERHSQAYTEGTQLILRGYSGDSCGGGVHVGVPTGLHARARTFESELSAASVIDICAHAQALPCAHAHMPHPFRTFIRVALSPS
jgi:hypothetical protein